MERFKHFKFTKQEYYIRFAVIGLAALTPIIFLLTQGYHQSISTYWRTPMQPLFILSNIFTAYYLYTMPRWKKSALLLLALTAFSIDCCGPLHNLLAVAFFIANMHPLYKTKHFTICFYLYIFSCFIAPFDMMLMETIAIMVLCLYHGLILNRIRVIQSKS